MIDYVRQYMKENERKLLLESDKRILFTYGFRCYHPTTLDVPITHEEAIRLINEGKWAHFEIEEKEDAIYLNLYSASDML